MLEEHYWLVVFVLCGVLAAIMSTASSVVLTLASIFTNDLYVPLTRKPLDDAGLARVGRWFTLVILVLVVIASAEPTTSLWRLTEIKVEFLMQLFPPLILGLYWQRYTKAAALSGVLAGSFVVGTMMLADVGRWWLFQAGLWGLAANFLIGVTLTLASTSTDAERDRVRQRFFALFG
jgi:Na+/proline symporter